MIDDNLMENRNAMQVRYLKSNGKYKHVFKLTDIQLLDQRNDAFVHLYDVETSIDEHHLKRLNVSFELSNLVRKINPFLISNL